MRPPRTRSTKRFGTTGSRMTLMATSAMHSPIWERRSLFANEERAMGDLFVLREVRPSKGLTQRHRGTERWPAFLCASVPLCELLILPVALAISARTCAAREHAPRVVSPNNADA